MVPLMMWCGEDSVIIFHQYLGPDLIQYLKGTYPPNYPVPALPVTVSIHRCCTILRERHITNTDDYSLMKIYPDSVFMLHG